MPRGTRSRDEDLARSQVRSFCSRLGTKIHKTHSLDNTPLVSVEPCDKWPQGLITVFHGWKDVMNRLVDAANEPETVTDGYLIIGRETFHHTQEAAE